MAGSVIYELPYIRYNYYDVMKQALSINNEQSGNLMSIYGFVSIACYFPGGWLADHVSCKKLMVFSLFASGILGLYYSTFPDYAVCVVIHVLWAVTTSLTFWSAMIKATKRLGNANEQGKLLGFLEGGRGLAPMIYGSLILLFFNQFGAGTAGFRFAVIAYSLLMILSGILTAVFMKESEIVLENAEKSSAASFFSVLKIPEVWLMGIIVFSAYFLYAGQSYLTAYLTEIYKESSSAGALFGLVRTYLLAVLVAPVCGIIRDKVGRTLSIMQLIFVAAVFFAAALIFLPSVFAIVADAVLLALAVFAMRGIYFSITDDIGLRAELSGAAIGLISLIGFTPDAFIYSLYGYWLDKYPGICGYRILFVSMVICALLGTLSCAALQHFRKRSQH